SFSDFPVEISGLHRTWAVVVDDGHSNVLEELANRPRPSKGNAAGLTLPVSRTSTTNHPSTLPFAIAAASMLPDSAWAVSVQYPQSPACSYSRQHQRLLLLS